MTRLALTTGACALSLTLAVSCRSAPAPQPVRGAPAPSQVAAPAETRPAAQAQADRSESIELGAREQQFLVHTESQEVVLLSSALEGRRVLVPHADAALYQPELELIWFRDQDRFAVADLRKPGVPAIILASGMPEEHRLKIERGREMVSIDDGCDLPFVALEWSERPVLEAYLTDAPDLRIDNKEWFAAELARPARADGKSRSFSGAKVRLPKKIMGCDLPDSCGKSAPFGADGKQLVLVVERVGGDCVERACLLHDPGTGLFATPPKAAKWASAKETAPGSCGPYLFDQAKTSFLVDQRLCSLDHGCRDLGGEALGWLVPGDRVGAPGTGDFPE